MSKKTTQKQEYLSVNDISEFIRKGKNILAISELAEKIKQAKSLSLKIRKFLQKQRPSLSERHALRECYYKLQTITSSKCFPDIFTREREPFYSHEIIGELFLIAEKLYFGNKEEFLNKYYSLDQDIQKEIDPFLQYMQGSLQTIESTSSLCEFTKHSIRITQGIVGYIQVVTDSWVIHPIPTKKEIDILFSELKKLKQFH